MVPNYIPVAPNAKFTLQDLKPDLQVNKLVDRSGCDRGQISVWSALGSLYVWTTQRRIKEAPWRLADAKQISSMLNN